MLRMVMIAVLFPCHEMSITAGTSSKESPQEGFMKKRMKRRVSVSL
jgi:hypothetical protein